MLFVMNEKCLILVIMFDHFLVINAQDFNNKTVTKKETPKLRNRLVFQ